MFDETNSTSVVLDGLEAYSTYEIEVAPISSAEVTPLLLPRVTWENGVTMTVLTGEAGEFVNSSFIFLFYSCKLNNFIGPKSTRGHKFIFVLQIIHACSDSRGQWLSPVKSC